jgi:DNA repair protein RadC
MAINDWSEQERPRERLVREGAAALSNPELLALLLRVGVRGKSAVELGRDVLQHFGSLHGLFGASLTDFSQVNGLGMAKYAQLQAVMELARRAIAEQMQAGQSLHSPDLVKRYLRMRLGGQHHESFIVLFVDVKHRLITDRELFRGTINHTAVYPREVVREALACHASAVMIAHNHPSGVAEPSDADLLLTQRLSQALDLVDIRLLDHFIVAGPLVHSFAEHGQL